MKDRLENAPALEVIERYDREETLFYLDPPYVHESRGDNKAYAHEMSRKDHIEMGELLQGIKGRAVVCGYKNSLYKKLFKDWIQVDAEEKTCNSSKGKRQESLWLNFTPGIHNL